MRNLRRKFMGVFCVIVASDDTCWCEKCSFWFVQQDTLCAVAYDMPRNNF